MPCSHCLRTRLLSGKYPCPTLSLSTTLSPPSFSLLSLLPPYSYTPPPRHSFSVSLSLFLFLVFVYLGFVPGISPVSLPAPRRLHPLDEQHAYPQPPSSSHPATLTPSHPHPALPRVLLSNCLPRELVPVSANRIEGTYFLNRAVAQRGDIAFSTIEPAFTYGVHTLPQVIEPTHCTCMLWRIKHFDQSPCRHVLQHVAAAHRLVAAGSVWLLPHRRIFFFTAVAKQSRLSCLTCEIFVIFTEVPDTILSLFSPLRNPLRSVWKGNRFVWSGIPYLNNPLHWGII